MCDDVTYHNSKRKKAKPIKVKCEIMITLSRYCSRGVGWAASGILALLLLGMLTTTPFVGDISKIHFNFVAQCDCCQSATVLPKAVNLLTVSFSSFCLKNEVVSIPADI